MRALVLLAALIFCDATKAHKGGTDAYGCHNERATGLYHCHSGPLAGRSFSSQAAMLAALGSPTPTPTPTPAPTGSSTYNRDDYLPDWGDADGDCMNTRHEVLQAESTIPVTLSSSGCTVLAGRWYDPYTGLTFTNPSDVDIDHLVPLKEAHESGAALWSTTAKRAYANDLTNPLVLIAVDDGTNSSKGDKDPALWMPPRVAYHCDYVRSWVAVKDTYNLTIDAAEQAAIDAVLSPGLNAEPWTSDAYRFISSTTSERVSGRFTIEVERADRCGYLTSAHRDTSIQITGIIEPPADHVGHVVDVFFVERTSFGFAMRDTRGEPQYWSTRVPELVPVKTGVLLTSKTEVVLQNEAMRTTGDHRYFMGYKLDGILYYSPFAAVIEATQ
jgi:hypothetical protein